MAKTRVLVVDDAVVVRRLVTQAIEAEPGLEVAGVAANGRIALAKIPQLNPDVVTLDIEMPEMDGLETLRRLRQEWPRLPVIMFSTLTERGATATLDALSLGATDYVTKPSGATNFTEAMGQVQRDLVGKITALCPGGAPAPAVVPSRPSRPVAFTPPVPLPSAPVGVVTIGISTGGPNALSEMLPLVSGDLPVPLLIVQHMPPVFTKFLAERLNTRCRLTVKEAEDGDRLQPGWAYIAPGGQHMVARRHGTDVVLALNEDPPENSCRPAVDVLFRSVAAAYGSATLAVVMTGMGQDGLRGAEHVRDVGGRVLAQDEASSVVWGMPGFVAKAGLADAVLPLSEMAAEIDRRVAARPGARGASPKAQVLIR